MYTYLTTGSLSVEIRRREGAEGTGEVKKLALKTITSRMM